MPLLLSPLYSPTHLNPTKLYKTLQNSTKPYKTQVNICPHFPPSYQAKKQIFHPKSRMCLEALFWVSLFTSMSLLIASVLTNWSCPRSPTLYQAKKAIYHPKTRMCIEADPGQKSIYMAICSSRNVYQQWRFHITDMEFAKRMWKL